MNHRDPNDRKPFCSENPVVIRPGVLETERRVGTDIRFEHPAAGARFATRDGPPRGDCAGDEDAGEDPRRDGREPRPPCPEDGEWVEVNFENRDGGRVVLEFNRQTKRWRIPARE